MILNFRLKINLDFWKMLGAKPQNFGIIFQNFPEFCKKFQKLRTRQKLPQKEVPNLGPDLKKWPNHVNIQNQYQNCL